MIQDFEFCILDAIQSNVRTDYLDKIIPAITYLGSGGIIWIITAVILLLFESYRKCGIQMSCGLILGLIIGNLILKNLIARSRPCWINENVELLISVPKDYSFPSGHTMSSICCAVILLHYDKRIGIPALILAIAIAFSRLYLYVHFPSDILAGAVIGAVIAIAVIYAFKTI